MCSGKIAVPPGGGGLRFLYIYDNSDAKYYEYFTYKIKYSMSFRIEEIQLIFFLQLSRNKAQTSSSM
jgi:hypothetical protein